VWRRGSLPSDATPPPAINETNLPLALPDGFKISIFARDLPEARVMRFDRFGNLWVSRTKEGAVTLLEITDGRVVSQDDIFTGLKNPHGLAFDPGEGLQLYIAEEHRLWRVTTYSDDPGEDLLTFPVGGHFTRTIGFGPDGRLSISVGSSCNVCRERDERRAAILSYDIASGKTELFARGLRNAVFFTWDAFGRMWATEMGRDELGDDLPPDEINIIEAGGPSAPLGTNDYGWPICYGKNVHDNDFDPVPSPQAGSYGAGKNVYVRDPCADKEPSAIDIPAHSAPLGLAFIPLNSTWPEEYWYDLLVAYHGSWNRSQPTGYKVVRHKFDAAGNYEGVEDFITGWLAPSGVEGLTPSGDVLELGRAPAALGRSDAGLALGRPVDIIVLSDGTAYISDDKAGVIYRVSVITPPR
ncbi:MAG: PQQ-dependent sugar dehydrogenase, partial [bacterium]|nr:PQQ-dependent sugar dehydrogenase [bacterium]